MIPRPYSFSIRVIAAGFALAVWALAPAGAVNPLFLGTYDAAGDRTLAVSKIGDIREKDFLEFLVMRDDPFPDIVAWYVVEPDYTRRQELRERLHKALEDYLIVLAAPRQNLREKYPRQIERQAEEMYVYPVYDWVWADFVARNELGLTPGDLRKFYNDNLTLFTRDASVTVRLIYKRVDEDDAAGIQAAEALLAGLRQKAVAGEDFAELARRNSDAPSAKDGGLLPAIIEGAMFTAFDDNAAELKDGEVSEIFRGPGGMYLAKLEERSPQHLPEFAEIKDEVLERLRPHVLRYRQVYSLENMMYTSHNFCRPQAWKGRHDEDWLVRVDPYILTVGDFQRLFPEVVSDDCLTNEALLRRQTGLIFMGEIMRAQCAQKGLLNGALIQRARELAPSMLKVSRIMAERQRPFAHPTPEALEELRATRPELFTPMTRYTLAKITASLKKPESFKAVERLEKVNELKEKLAEALAKQVIVLREINREAAALAKDERSTTGAESVKLKTYADALQGFDPEVYDVRFERMSGYYDLDTLPEDLPAEEIANLQSYSVVGPLSVDNRVVFFACEEASAPEMPAKDKMMDIIKREYARLHAGAARQELLDEAMSLADVSWVYDQLPYQPSEHPEKGAVPRRAQATTKKAKKPATSSKRVY